MGKVFVYRNLAPQYRKDVMWSLKDQRTGLVVARERTVLLTDVQFKVSQAGRKRVLATGRKAVHAGCVGIPAPIDLGVWLDQYVRVTYNPYKYETFVRCDTGEPVTSASKVFINSDGVFAVL